MVAYDSTYDATPAAQKRSTAAAKLSELLGRKSDAASAGLDPVAPAPDYALTPDKDGKITLAGRKVPLALAALGVIAAGALLANKRTRGPILAAATTAWGVMGQSDLMSKILKKR